MNDLCFSDAPLEQFSKADFYKLALQKLEACPVAMERLGCPPLKVHNIHLSDRTNHIDGQTAQVLTVLSKQTFVLEKCGNP